MQNLNVLQYFFSFRFSQVSRFYSTFGVWARFQSPREALSSEVISSGNVSSSSGRTKHICIHFTTKHRWKSLRVSLKYSHPPQLQLRSCAALVWVFFLQSEAWRPLWSPYLSAWSPSPSFNGTHALRYKSMRTKHQWNSSKDTHVQCLLLGLSHPVAAALCLFVIVRVAVDIVKDDHIGRGQVNAQPSSSGGQQEHKYVLVCVELVNQPNSVKAQSDLQLLSIYLIGI